MDERMCETWRDHFAIDRGADDHHTSVAIEVEWNPQQMYVCSVVVQIEIVTKLQSEPAGKHNLLFIQDPNVCTKQLCKALGNAGGDSLKWCGYNRHIWLVIAC